MPENEPCDLACQTKIIINGRNISGISASNNAAIAHMSPEALSKLDGKALIALLNRMEDDAVEVQKLIVKGVGYTGETGKMLN